MTRIAIAEALGGKAVDWMEQVTDGLLSRTGIRRDSRTGPGGACTEQSAEAA